MRFSVHVWARLVLLSGLGSALLGCGGPSQAVYLTETNRGYARENTEGFDEESGSMKPGGVRLNAKACEGYDLQPDYKSLSYQELVQFLQQRGFKVKVTQRRSDLVYLDLTGKGDSVVRLRVATLGDAQEAGRDLHQAILEHGPGTWGVHRSNLAVLGPIGNTEKVVYFAVRSKLACWGELMIAGRDDLFVIPGGYQEL
ncbi:MAG: hypothetical protein H6718_30195 [Polyangiaceae bacterium]|nr:hypothetical protein [Polyangiaceae bacterium]